MEDYADRIASNVEVILACKNFKNDSTESFKNRLGPSECGVLSGFFYRLLCFGWSSKVPV